MTETTKVRKLNRLDIDDKGAITLEGKVVDAKPVGKPFLIICLPDYTYGRSLDKEFHNTILHERLLKEVKLPTESNAYVRSDGITKYVVHVEYVPEVRFAVQLYQVLDKKE